MAACKWLTEESQGFIRLTECGRRYPAKILYKHGVIDWEGWDPTTPTGAPCLKRPDSPWYCSTADCPYYMEAGREGVTPMEALWAKIDKAIR